ncbi:hypothetical protein [Mucilaginibacter sp.]|uniref:hypothetical protein n=1 Tax=Mucilaginibacter sp. TaxID=1882438 RepID=UPI000CAD3E18|nr:hypothetical protein [Mucilaginibacter sp.]PLW88745.1 MAG: hypothetical protein C0154_15180 [Mucilaginibacter sp.]PMP65696.1 MAG: hypothetical protein C0191_03010 [Mucilaginibacter sp.]HEK20683.1 hypothetical protein [Bacteroidota bacterium]
MLKLITTEVKTSYTHRIHFDVLMKDLTERKFEVNFNGWDEWEDSASPFETANLFYRIIIRGLDKDELTLGWKATIFNLEHNKKVTEYMPWVKASLQ